jgi:hypothetical protein
VLIAAALARLSPETVPKSPPMYTREPSGESAMARTTFDADGSHVVSSAAVVASSRATRPTATPPIDVNQPPA